MHNPPHAHKDRSLVQFTAMVQDTSLSHELYLASPSCGGWGLAPDDTSGENISYTNLRECSVLWAVTIPGKNPWCASVTDEFRSLDAPYQPCQPHKFPIPWAPHVGVQVKIYDLRYAESFKPTDLLTFVGILTFEPLHTDIDLPSPIMVPTLHVLFLQLIPLTIVPRSYPYLPPNPLSISDIRDELIAWIADQALAGDRMTAEWILLCVIARVRSRSPPMLPPSLTISNFPLLTSDSSVIPSLIHVLSHILPTLSTLPLSLSVLNTTAFAPESKDENLSSGWLQLPKGSVCLITESGVTEGVVSEHGIINIRAVQDVINAQTLEYIFPYSRFIFDTDIGIFILTQGEKSAFFQTSINIPLQLAATTNIKKTLYKSADAIVLPVKEKLDMFRKLVGSAKIGNVSIPNETAEYIQDDFVNERRTVTSSIQSEVASEGFTSDDLIQRMMVVRLLALSLQENEISVGMWKRAKQLDAARKARMK